MVYKVCSDCGGLVAATTAVRGKHPDCHLAAERVRNKARVRTHEGARLHQTAEHRELRKRVLERDRYTCWHCGKHPLVGFDATLDYIVPLQDGGQMHPANAVSSCRSCNAKAGRRTVRRRAGPRDAA